MGSSVTLRDYISKYFKTQGLNLVNKDNRYFMDTGRYRIYISNCNIRANRYEFDVTVRETIGGNKTVFTQSYSNDSVFIEYDMPCILNNLKDLGFIGSSRGSLDIALSSIANQYLNVDTLDTRNSDSLDFYDVSVWGIKAALNAAYELGVKSK